MWPKKLAVSCLLIVLTLTACETLSTPTVRVSTPVSAPSAPPMSPDIRFDPPTLAPYTPTPAPRLRSGEQSVWTNSGDETDTLLVTLQSSHGQVEEGESTLITASANNMSGSPLDVSLIIQLGAGLMVSSSSGCSGRVQATSPCWTTSRLP